MACRYVSSEVVAGVTALLTTLSLRICTSMGVDNSDSTRIGEKSVTVVCNSVFFTDRYSVS